MSNIEKVEETFDKSLEKGVKGEIPLEECAMTLAEAKKTFPLNVHWVDCSQDPKNKTDEFPLKPLCVCFIPEKMKEYKETDIPIGKHILTGTDASGVDVRIILCDKCLKFNLDSQKKEEKKKKKVTFSDKVDMEFDVVGDKLVEVKG